MTEKIAGRSSRRREGHNWPLLRGDPEKIVLGGRRQHLGRARGMLVPASRFSRVQLCVTLWPIACQAPLSMGFSGQEYWSELPCPPPGDLYNPGIKPMSPVSHAFSG